MKKMMLSAALVLCALAANAKDETKYCELNVYQPAFKRYVLEVNYGDLHKRGFKKLKDAKGKAMKFESKLDALGYMTKEGWELVSAYRMPHCDETRYVLRKQ